MRAVRGTSWENAVVQVVRILAPTLASSCIRGSLLYSLYLHTDIGTIAVDALSAHTKYWTEWNAKTHCTKV